MSQRSLTSAALFLALIGSIGTVFATEDENTGVVLSIGKVTATLCAVKVQGATFPNSCATAVYQQAYFVCDATQGKDYLSIALAARITGTPVRIVTDSCSPYGSSVANLMGIHID